MALTVRIRADASHFKKTIAGIEVQASGLTGVMAKLGGAVGSVGLGAALAAAAAGAAALGAGLAFIKSSSGAAMSMESLTTQIEVLTGSSETAADLIKKFREEAIKSPLSVKDYADASKLLMGYGVAAKDTIPALKMLGDVSLGNAERFGRLALVYGQIATKGRLMAQENNQLAESGFAPLREIAKKTGESISELMDRMEKGGITSGEVAEAFKSATSAGGLFYGALDRGSSTTEGKIAKLNDAILGLKVAFGTGFNEGLKSALDATNAFLPQLESKFAAAGKVLGNAIKRAVEGDLELFAQIGILIADAVAEGFKDVAGNAVVEMLRAHATKQGLEKGRSPEHVKKVTDNFFGPRRTVSQRAADIAETLQGNVQGIKKSVADDEQKRWTEYLKRQYQATEELVRQGKAATKANVSDLMFSR